MKGAKKRLPGVIMRTCLLFACLIRHRFHAPAHGHPNSGVNSRLRQEYLLYTHHRSIDHTNSSQQMMCVK